MRILFVDDEADFLELMKSRLDKRGIFAITATNGAAALKILAKNEIDAVVLDVKLAGESGIDVLQEMKKINANTPVLLLSGHASPTTALLGMEGGAADYMIKPVPLNDLITRLRDIVAKKL